MADKKLGSRPDSSVPVLYVDQGDGTWAERVAMGSGGSGATSLGKAEDAAHVSGDVGVEMLAVRQDTQAALAADGDYIPLTTGPRGSLRVVSGGYTAKPSCVLTRGANTTPYTVGDEVGTAGTAPTTFTAGRTNAGTGFITGCTGIYSNYPAVTPDLVLLVFSGTVTLAGDNAQLNLSDADAAKCIAVLRTVAVEAGSYSAGAPASAGNLIMSFAPTVAKAFACGASEQTLYVAAFTKIAFTPIANSETLSLFFDVSQD